MDILYAHLVEYLNTMMPKEECIIEEIVCTNTEPSTLYDMTNPLICILQYRNIDGFTFLPIPTTEEDFQAWKKTCKQSPKNK